MARIGSFVVVDVVGGGREERCGGVKCFEHGEDEGAIGERSQRDP